MNFQAMQTTINTLEYDFLSNFGFNSDEEREKNSRILEHIISISNSIFLSVNFSEWPQGFSNSKQPFYSFWTVLASLLA